MDDSHFHSLLESDLAMAEKVYRSLLPGRLTLSGVDIVTRLWPYNRVGGDYATVFPTRDQVYVCISDVTAHGIASSLLVTRVDSFVRERVPLAHHPCEIVEELNKFLWDNFRDVGLFLSFFCGTIDLTRKEFSYAGCGHPPGMLFKASEPGTWKPLASQHTLVGLSAALSTQCFIDREPVEPGDRIVLYTDGFSEAMNGEMELLGEDRLAEIISDCLRESPEGSLLADQIWAVVNHYQGEAAHDDSTLMVVTML